MVNYHIIMWFEKLTDLLALSCDSV